MARSFVVFSELLYPYLIPFLNVKIIFLAFDFPFLCPEQEDSEDEADISFQQERASSSQNVGDSETGDPIQLKQTSASHMTLKSEESMSGLIVLLYESVLIDCKV